MTKENIINRVINLLQENVESCKEAAITGESGLLESSLLDSFSLVSLLPVFEKEFEITFDIENLEIEDFSTSASIADMIINMK